MRGALLGVVGGLVLAAPAVAADHPVGFASYAYTPPDLTIAVNDTVTFSGTGGEDFSDHPLDWNGNVFAETGTGSSKQFTFSAPGTYAYFCRFHVNSHDMKGVIRVAGNLHPARVSFSASPTTATVGQPVTFAYTGDPDPDGTLVRWEWDLDGDGSFETSTNSGTATHAYASPGAVTVRMRAIDNGNEASAVAEQAVNVVAASSSGSSATDRTAPLVTRLKLKGLTLSFRSSERASATATLRRRGKTLAKGTAKLGTTTIRLKLTKAGRSALRRGHRVKVTLTLTLRDASANARTVKRTVAVKRS
jgi:plastocyanin